MLPITTFSRLPSTTDSSQHRRLSLLTPALVSLPHNQRQTAWRQHLLETQEKRQPLWRQSLQTLVARQEEERLVLFARHREQQSLEIIRMNRELHGLYQKQQEETQMLQQALDQGKQGSSLLKLEEFQVQRVKLENERIVRDSRQVRLVREEPVVKQEESWIQVKIQLPEGSQGPMIKQEHQEPSERPMSELIETQSELSWSATVDQEEVVEWDQSGLFALMHPNTETQESQFVSESMEQDSYPSGSLL